MKNELEEVLNDLIKMKKFSRTRAIKYLQEEIKKICGMNKSITKVIDEYNWLKAHGKL